MDGPLLRDLRQCPCEHCKQDPQGDVAQNHRSINRLVAVLNERNRRMFVGFLASLAGHGGTVLLEAITGLSRPTIRRGLRELKQGVGELDGRVRCRGGGRKDLKKKTPDIVNALEEAVQDATAGDPMTGLRWTHKTTRNLAEKLQRRGYAISHASVGRLLHQGGYSLRTNRKRLARTQVPERDAQFRFMQRQRRRFFRQNRPVLSVDTKKKELVGNFKNAGVCWRKKERAVRDHDFPSEASGHAIPYGIYDQGRNTGFVVVVGTSHETPEFAVAALRTWWLKQGRRHYPGATHWLIEADCGGPNGNRIWRWKIGLQRLANEFGVTITVAHVPTAASKWNRIEHRMFNLISANWAGAPLETYETVLNFIRTTKSSTGFRCWSELDPTVYLTRLKVTKEEKQSVRLQPHKTLPQWNYTIRPHKK